MVARLVREFRHGECLVRIGEDKPGSFKAVAFDKNRNIVANGSGSSADLAAADIKSQLNANVSTYVGLPGAINVFLAAFPKGFADRLYRDWERDYKDDAADFVAESFGEGKLREAAAKKSYNDIAAVARQAIQRTNLLSPYESMAFSDFLKKPDNQATFANLIIELLYGSEFLVTLEKLTAVLKPHNAAKWPIVTYWGFCRYPDRHMFLKPTITRDAAERLGFDFEYDPTPNRRTYESLLKLTEHVRSGLAELDPPPRDNIDVQSFLWTIGYKEYVKLATEERKKRGLV